MLANIAKLYWLSLYEFSKSLSLIISDSIGVKKAKASLLSLQTMSKGALSLI
jgi:hypothetical protein